MVEFKFKRCYKLQRAAQQTKLVHLWIEKLYTPNSLSRALFDLCLAFIEPLNMQMIDFRLDTMESSEEVMDITKMNVEEAAQALTVRDSLQGIEIVA